MKIYFAKPISGCKCNDVFEYYERITRVFSLYDNTYGVKTFHPMVGKQELRCDLEFRSHGYDNMPTITNHAILQRDLWMVEQSDIVLVNLLDAEMVSIGCCMELAVAHWLRKHTVTVLEEGNLHNHAFVFEASDVIFNNEQDAINYIVKLIRSTKGKLAL